MNHTPEKSGPLVGVVVVTYNGSYWIGSCIKSIQGSTYSNIVIVVIDNASRDDTVLILEKEFPGLKVIQFPRNRGYAAASNKGIEVVMSLGAEFVLILNQDIVLEEKCIEEMVWAAQEKGSSAIYSPFQLSYDGEHLDPIFARNVVGKSAEIVSDLWRGRLARTYQVEEIIGAAMMVHSRVLKSIGMLDELFFMYGEDSDYCRRAKCAGFYLCIVPSAVVRHWHALAQPTEGQSRVDFFFERSELLYLLKDPTQTFVHRILKATWCSFRGFWWNFRRGQIRRAAESIQTYFSVVKKLPYIERACRIDSRMIKKALMGDGK